jgi:hypothetical protein
MAEDRADEIMRHFDVVAERLEGQIRLVAEGHHLIREELKAFRAEAAGEFSELRSMIKFSYAELDRRIRTLEGAVVSLADRVDRLEARKS